MQYDSQGFVLAPDGTRLFYGIRGAGPVVVLNDGIGCDGFAWKYLQPALAERFRVIHWHYRGHGRSGPPLDPARLGIVDLASDQLALLDALGVEHALEVGHSMGTQVALEAYARAPERVTGLVLLCGSYGRVTTTFHGSDVLENVLPSILRFVERYRGVARGLWGRMPANLAFHVARLGGEIDGLALRQEDFRHYAEHVAHMEPNVFFQMLKGAGDHTAEALLPAIRVPTLVVAAERDTFTPAAVAKHMADVIPEAEYYLVTGGSHAAPAEQPRSIMARVDDFLRRRVPA